MHRTETAVDMNDTQVQQEVVTIQKHMHRLTKFIHIFNRIISGSKMYALVIMFEENWYLVGKKLLIIILLLEKHY